MVSKIKGKFIYIIHTVLLLSSIPGHQPIRFRCNLPQVGLSFARSAEISAYVMVIIIYSYNYKTTTVCTVHDGQLLYLVTTQR